MRSFNMALGRLASFGPLITRIIIGALFFWHGIDKFRTGLSNVEGFFASSGVPLAGFTAPLTAVLEIALGAALILGLFTRLSALILSGVMVGAIIWVKGTTVLGGNELDLVYLAGLLSLVLVGPGALSADEVLDQDMTVIDLRSSPDRMRASVSL